MVFRGLCFSSGLQVLPWLPTVRVCDLIKLPLVTIMVFTNSNRKQPRYEGCASCCDLSFNVTSYILCAATFNIRVHTIAFICVNRGHTLCYIFSQEEREFLSQLLILPLLLFVQHFLNPATPFLRLKKKL